MSAAYFEDHPTDPDKVILRKRSCPYCKDETETEQLRAARDSLLLLIAKLRGDIETLHAMYEQVSRQRDELMDVQRSMVEAMRGRMQ